MLSPPRPLLETDDLTAFGSGNDVLDEWLRVRARKGEGRTARTYVVSDGSRIVAYYSLATGGVRRHEMAPKLARNTPDPVPVVILGRLAVDRQFQGLGMGSMLVRDALQRALAVADIAGVRAATVHAIDEAAARFYSRLGFEEFLPGRGPSFSR